jgi:hypothetical protein
MDEAAGNRATQRVDFWRRLLRFRLRTLLIWIFILSVPLAGYVWWRERARRQAQAVATIERLGGRVYYDGQVVDGIVHDEPPLTRWQRWLGKDFFYDVVEVSQQTGRTPNYVGVIGPLPPSPTEAEKTVERAEADAFWRAAARFKRLRELNTYGDWASYGNPKRCLGTFTELRDLHIDDAELTDNDLIALERLAKLERLFLEGNQVGDETVKRLSGCVHLKSVDLSDTLVTDEGLRYLASSEELEWLSLGGTKISDEGLKHVGRLRSLHFLELHNTSISDAGLKHLAPLANLEDLSLWSTRVSGAGLTHLERLSRLDNLDLSHCPVDGQGARYVARLEHLRWLDLSDTKIPAEAFAEMTWPQSLEDLDLDYSEVDDRGLAPLLKLKSLGNVGLLRTKVTREALDRFNQLRPGILTWLSNDASP